ncbi:tRNA (guanosine(46)-N7)-methyltransferase TrmB [Buchnera aphidicola]|uniref:tRNA (guanine-N(7)-)-methyltransferase n=1 Tax=Buchnera aphidicola str. USDA (Myzus persicae) TaxID=1009856 RepID=W0P467_BUCMP|nr:tRNA (guanosine(46)-N7)-methyltransferase TrmB [Buchnera aphidicola]AHG59853.1 Yggh [Buchnera aphidicola str. USDA (Myzus persicae)]AHG60433.1 Yggh [Buchnera aphidicola str. W106 (Myzus persicae)]AHG61006.1 Yggh [Buchnera aphidicola str. G002 (Myzus persicae)]AHG61578.1 Yggh [Buchnera aphidicola str. F009 (Myzus persicae)]WAI02908.1 MAG: tRNA (guanosine(46)-N7)-methyltransferase TrmB [Buchnera aphidicola (Myzus persicae)]
MKNNILIHQYDQNGTILRQIRSFVCRTSRVTQSQLNSIQKYWSLMGIDFQLKELDFLSTFNSNSPVVLEIGFGSGESLVKNAINYPDKNFLGIEVYKSGIGSCLHFSYISKIQNLRIIYHDATEVFHHMIMNKTLLKVQIFFPDPWEKKRHHKRRLLQSNFLKIISTKIMMNGILHIVTDSKEYAFYILQEIKNIKNYINLSKNNNYIKQPISRIMTKFEQKALVQGKKIFDLVFQLKE